MENDLVIPPTPPPSPATLARALSAVKAEAALPRRASWRRDAVLLGALTGGLGLLIAAVGVFTGAFELSVVLSRAATIAPVLAAGLLASWASLTPGQRPVRFAALALAATAAVLLVAGRAMPSSAGTTPEWVCTASHLGIEAIPLVAVVVMLRRMAPNRLRAVVAGLSVGATGAMVGELACGRGPLHVATFHLGAWAIATLAAVLLAAAVKPRSFAP